MCQSADCNSVEKRMGEEVNSSDEGIEDMTTKRQLCTNVVKRYQKMVLYQQHLKNAMKTETKPICIQVMVANKKPKQSKQQDANKKGAYNLQGKQHRVSQSDKWYRHYRKLLMFRKKYGHSIVPCVYDENPSLSRWVRRQRFHYYLKTNGKKSSMKQERINMLDDIGFVWHAREAQWQEQFNELLLFKKTFGHCAIPTIFAPKQKLATWAKLQRRQYRLYQEGRPSYITADRIALLEKQSFKWKLSS
mmetsp:Transcript_96/g.130  ORF Transcript_96/g.130 Transcript_96/m.130 type:complete len:247 (+) Transcript_96:87-827(+)